MIGTTKRVAKVSAAYDVIIPAQSEYVVEGSADIVDFSCDGLIEPKLEFPVDSDIGVNNHGELIIGCTLVDTHRK